jgi:peptidyl-prolyl cis-trans isomerase C
MARKISTVLLLIAVIGMSACTRSQTDGRPPEAGDQAVAKVGDWTIWASDVKREAVAQGLIGEGEPLDASSDMFRQVLDGVIDQKLLAAEAVKRKLEQDPAVQRRLAAARDRILGDVLVERSVERAVNENNIRGLYQELQRSTRPSEEFRARQIVTTTAAEAQAVAKLLSAGATFESLVLAKSTDAATRFAGGDLGYFTTDVMPDGYEAALKDAKTGQVVGPFQTDAGWVLLKVEDRRPEQPISLEEAKPQIVRFLTYSDVRDMLENLRKNAKIKVLIAEPPSSAREPASAPAARAAPAPGPSPRIQPAPSRDGPPAPGALPATPAKP